MTGGPAPSREKVSPDAVVAAVVAAVEEMVGAGLRLRDKPWYPQAAVALAIALFLAAFGLAARNAAPPVPEKRAVVKQEPTATPVFVPRTDVDLKPIPIPTPLLAKYRSLPLHLPVKPDAITLIAFHQAGSRPAAVRLDSLVSIVKSSELKKPRPSEESTGPDESAEIAAAEEQSAIPDVWAGQVLRLWRSGRSGEPNTAVDVGAKAGSAVYAPVSGTVAAVHRYSLYGQYSDYEIHILPKGWAEVDLCILHVTDPKVKVGEEVQAGVTQVASVRKLSKWFDSQLDEYTHDGGDHVHLQLDRVPRRGCVELMGGLEAEFGRPKESTQADPGSQTTRTAPLPDVR